MKYADHGRRTTAFVRYLLIFFCIACNSAGAAEMDAGEQKRIPEAGESDSASKQTNEETQSNGTGNTGKRRDQEIFRPSEEISEDFAVSFPVDI